MDDDVVYGCLALGFVLLIVAMFVALFVTSITTQARRDAYRIECVEAGGYPAFGTEIGDLCVTDTVEVTVDD